MLQYLITLLPGIYYTLLVTSVAFCAGAALGLPLSLARTAPQVGLRLPARTFIDFVRSIPTIVWLFLVFFALTPGSFTLSRVAAAVAALSLVASAHMAEIYRGGLKSVPSGQWEASLALGLSRPEVLWLIVGPQALRVAIPGGGALAIGLLKESAIVSIIGVRDVTFYSFDLVQRTMDGVPVYTMAAVIYIAMSIGLALIARSLESMLSRSLR